jgi:toluene monooxygenase system ferredoxin subunit
MAQIEQRTARDSSMKDVEARSNAVVRLEHCGLFTGLPPGVLERIQAFVCVREFDENATIFNEGDPAEELFLLASGEVELDYTLPSQPDTVLKITRVAPGEVFAWSALAGLSQLSAKARTLKKSCVYAISGSDLREIFKSSPEAGYLVMSRLTAVVASRLLDSRLQLRWLLSAT